MLLTTLFFDLDIKIFKKYILFEDCEADRKAHRVWGWEEGEKGRDRKREKENSSMH